MPVALAASGPGVEVTEHCQCEILTVFKQALDALMQRLATLIVRDGRRRY